jgi:hypothetical protein
MQGFGSAQSASVAIIASDRRDSNGLRSMKERGCSSRTGSQGHGGDVDGQHQQDAHSRRTDQPWGEPVSVVLFQASLALTAGHRRLPPDGMTQGDVSAGS